MKTQFIYFLLILYSLNIVSQTSNPIHCGDDGLTKFEFSDKDQLVLNKFDSKGYRIKDEGSLRQSQTIKHTLNRVYTNASTISESNFTYNENAQNTTTITQTQSSETGTDWINHEKIVNEYDANSNLVLYEEYDWFNSISWRCINRHEYLLDEDANWQLLVISTLNSTNELITEDKYSFEYINNRIVGYDKEKWIQESAAWEANLRAKYFYNNYENLYLIEFKQYNKATETWVLANRTEYFFDENQNQTFYSQSYHSSNISSWIIEYHEKYSYSQEGNLIEKTIYEYDGNELLLPVQKEKYEYYFGTAISTITQWNQSPSISGWFLTYLTEHLYNPDYPHTELAVPSWYNYPLMLTKEKVYRRDYSPSEGMYWADHYETGYTYSMQSYHGIDAITNETVSVYPNPTNSFISIKLSENIFSATINISDISGKLLLSSEVSNESKVSLQHFAAGMYFYMLDLGTELKTGKIIKQ